MLGTREYTLCSPFRANAHNSSYSMKLSDIGRFGSIILDGGVGEGVTLPDHYHYFRWMRKKLLPNSNGVKKKI